MRAILLHEWKRLVIPKASATVFTAGQFVSVESSAAVHMDAATEDATFAGVVSIAAPAGVVVVTVCIAGVVEVDCTSGTFTLGAGVKYAAGDSTPTDYSVVDDGGANTIGNSYKVYSSAVTRMEMMFDVMALGKLFERNA